MTALLVFAVATVAEHVLEPGLSVGRHQVSEYANTRSGWLMTLGFAAWSAALVLTAALWPAPLTRMLFLAAGVGMILTACFDTQTVAGALSSGEERSSAGRLHDYGSLTTLLSLFLAAALTAVRGLDAPLVRAASVVAATAAVVVSAALLLGGDPVPGLRQRALLLLAIGWHAVALVAVRPRRPSPRGLPQTTP